VKYVVKILKDLGKPQMQGFAQLDAKPNINHYIIQARIIQDGKEVKEPRIVNIAAKNFVVGY